jgi:hypothetical protein
VNIPFLLCPSIKLVCRGFYLCAPLVCTPLARERVEITRDDAATRGAARRTHATRETGSGSSGGTAAGSGRFSTPPPPHPPSVAPVAVTRPTNAAVSVTVNDSFVRAASGRPLFRRYLPARSSSGRDRSHGESRKCLRCFSLADGRDRRPIP